MGWILLIFGIALFTFIANVAIKWSYNILFFILKKPLIWFFVMLLIGFSLLFASSFFENKLNMIAIASTLAFLVNIPPKSKEIADNDMKKLSDEMAEIKGSRMKYRLGLGFYVFGCILGWILGYGEIVKV